MKIDIRISLPILIPLLCIFTAILIIHFFLTALSALSFTTSIVYNTDKVARFTSHPISNSSHRAVDPEFYRMIEELNFNNRKIGQNDIEFLSRIRHWCRLQQGEFNPVKWQVIGKESDDPKELLINQRNSTPGACRRFAYILSGVLYSLGYDSRIVHIASTFSDLDFNHTLVEVYVPSLSKWVLIDSDYDTFYKIGDIYASLYEVYDQIRSKKIETIEFERNGSETLPMPRFVDENRLPTKLAKSFSHIYIGKMNAVKAYFDTGQRGKIKTFEHFVPDGGRLYPNFYKIFLIFMICVLLIVIMYCLYKISDYCFCKIKQCCNSKLYSL
ncbi:transglutaminase domain-containing protein [Desulfogranum japonicum]|uniref:transglutaminase domain-containing protein n=1 Tax=Desulfogranum japonicum TaxID=231447 RepID=UPI000406912D|nr:transglutaminase domain-containing protein [Desulfogranum japonicum]